jgi:hypothetical protein
METLEQRRANFDRFLQERMPVLVDFVERLQLPNPQLVIAEPDLYLQAVSDFMQDQIVMPEDRVWVLTRLGYFIGELLIQRFSGCWHVDEDPESRFFTRYVVGQFARVPRPTSRVDPFAVADAYLSEPPRRNLSKSVEEVMREISSR